tara:strand:- start:509 stop:1228 length:720 start_codon:yes stop_codon:yes gene_type:complete
MSSVLVRTGQKLSSLLERQGKCPDRRELIAEIHDFLAMLEGIKPVFLHGRSLAPKDWINEVLEIAQDLGLHIIKGPFWDALSYTAFPNWYADHCRNELQPYRAWYICKDDTVAETILGINRAGGHLTVSEEARLLGYPECCVQAHYKRSQRYHRGALAILKRVAGGNENKMRKLLASQAQLVPVTQEEIDEFEIAFDIYEAKFGSWNLCHACECETDTRSEVLSKQYFEMVQKAKLEID